MSSKLNVLFICSDQHTARVLAPYGDRIVETPNLDALAAGGCRFDACYCNNPICVPSRASFMTGRHSFKAEVLNNFDVLDSRIPTLPHIAVRGGYHAVLAGKMHFNGPDQRHGYLEAQAQELGTMGVHSGVARHTGDTIPSNWLGNCSRPEPLMYTGAGGNPMVAFDEHVTSGAVDWIGRYAGHGDDAPPFFLTVGYLLPHCPYIAPRDVYDKYEGRVKAHSFGDDERRDLHPHHHDYRRYIQLDDIPPENLDRAATAYYAMVDMLDQNVGRVLDALRQHGLWDNTIVVYFSDHGEMLGYHGRWHKESFFEDSVRVPMIVRHPHLTLPPSVSECCSLVDLMPTLCDWTGVTPPPGIDGASLQPLLEGRSPDEPRVVKAETYTFWHPDADGLSGNRMVRRGPWKLCYYGAYDSYELFNVEDDPEERRNLADVPAHASTVEQLRPLLFEDGWTTDVPARQTERLQQFGHYDNIKAYRETLRRNPLPCDVPDVWPGTFDCPSWLEPEHLPQAGSD